MPTARMPPKPRVLSSTSSRTRTLTPLGAVATAWSASHAGDLVDEGVLVRSRARWTACAVSWARSTAAARRSSTSSVTSRPGRSAATRPNAYAASARPSPKARTPSAEAPRSPTTAALTRPPSTARRSRSDRPTDAPARRSAATPASPDPTSSSALSGLSPSGTSTTAPARLGLLERARWASTVAPSGPPRSLSSTSSPLGMATSAPSDGVLTSETRMSARSGGVSLAAARRRGSGMGSPCHANGPGTPWVPGPPGGPFGNEQRSADGRLQGVTEVGCLIRRQLDDQTATAFKRDAHDDAPTLLGDFERTIARTRLHGRHLRSPFVLSPSSGAPGVRAPARTTPFDDLLIHYPARRGLHYPVRRGTPPTGTADRAAGPPLPPLSAP